MPKRVSVRSSIVRAAPTSACRMARVASTSMFGVDQVVVGVSEEGVPLMCACPIAPPGRIARRT
jgi:hypothetical protein